MTGGCTLAAIQFIFILFLASCSSEIEIEYQLGAVNKLSPNSVIESHITTSYNINASQPDFEIIFSDQDNSDLSWDCEFDQVIDSQVSSGQDCSTLVAANFSSASGYFYWAPLPAANGNYEIKISFSYQGKEYAKLIQVNVNFPALNVDPMFANHPNWNDYVKWSDKTKEVFEQTDVSCDPSSDVGFLSCLHAGERKIFTIPWLKSCESLVVSDQLSAFRWKCIVSNDEVVIYSLGLQLHLGLSDLIEYDGGGGSYVFKDNKLRVFLDDDLYVESSLSKWWNNSIQEAPNSSLAVQTISDDASDIGRIFLIDGDHTGYGYEILDDKTALITFGASSVYKSVHTSICNSTDGTQTSPDKSCMAFGSGKNFLWLEGFYDNEGATSTILFAFHNTSFSTLRKIKNINIGSGGDSFFLGNSHSNRFINIKMRANGGGAASFYTADNTVSHFLFYDITFTNATSTTSTIGFDPEGSQHVLSKIKGSHVGARVGYHGAFNMAGLENIATNVLVHSSIGRGIFFNTTADESILAFVSVFNSQNAGVYLRNSSSKNLVHNILSVGNEYGIETHDSQIATDYILSDIAVFENQTAGLSLYLNNSILTGFLAVGNNAGTASVLDDCVLIGGTSPGIINGSCTDSGAHLSNTYTGQSSDATLITNKDITSAILGKVTITDSANTKDNNGLQTYDGDNDFFNFENWFRSLGKDGGAFPSVDNKGSCTSGDCRIWDFRLSSMDTYFLNRSDDGLNANEVFQANMTCPSAVHGNKTLTNSVASTPLTFLKNASEIFFDDIGNDNGLCESNEACIYHPNIGAYQGEGGLSEETCSFVDGTVSNVSMYAYKENGGM